MLLKDINVSRLVNGYYLYTSVYKNQFVKIISDTLLSKHQARILLLNKYNNQ